MAQSATHPGKILADELKSIGVRPTKLARQINVPPNRISQIINGKRAITGDTALRLAHWFGNGSQFWMDLQTAHDVRTAEEQAGAAKSALPTKTRQERTVGKGA